MERNVEMKFARELKSFHHLTILSLIFGAIAMAISLAFVVSNIMAFINQNSIIHIIPTIIGLLTFSFAMRWLLAAVDVMDGVDEIKDEYTKIKEAASDELITGLIVKMLAHYRAKKPTISKLVLLCKVAAICFIMNGLLVLSQAILNNPTNALELTSSLAATLINWGIGIVGLFIPHSFQNYSSCWEVRAQFSAMVEKELEFLIERK
ncbi:MAG: hypothetical protein QXO23_02450 [Candidatus Methanomethyliaceae archaeon]